MVKTIEYKSTLRKNEEKLKQILEILYIRKKEFEIVPGSSNGLHTFNWERFQKPLYTETICNFLTKSMKKYLLAE